MPASTDPTVLPPGTADPAPDTATDPAPPVSGTRRAVWEALQLKPGATTAEVAQAAGVGRSTAAKALAALETQGLAVRSPGGRREGRVLPDRWHATGTPPAPDDEEAELHQPRDEEHARVPDTGPALIADRAVLEAGAPDPDPHGDPEEASEPQPPVEPAGPWPSAAAGRTGRRLGRGRLRQMVLDHLHAHPGQEFSPFAIAKALDRSAGAVANALEKLVHDGQAQRTSKAPKRYAAPQEQTTSS